MKIYNFVIFSAALIVLFYIAGFNTVLNSQLAQRVGIFNMTSISATPNTQGQSSSNSGNTIWMQLALLFLIGGGTSVVVGLLTGVNFAFMIKGVVIMTPLTGLIYDLISIFSMLGTSTIASTNWVFYVLLFVIGLLVCGYVIALTEYWEGRD